MLLLTISKYIVAKLRAYLKIELVAKLPRSGRIGIWGNRPSFNKSYLIIWSASREITAFL